MGYSAAELLRAPCAARDALAEVTMPGGNPHPCGGLTLHADALARDEVRRCAGAVVTAHLRAAYDLGRWCPELVDAVVAVDALSNRGGFLPQEVHRLARRYPRARHRRRLRRVVELADRRSGSPMEVYGEPDEIAAKIDRALRVRPR